MEGPSFSAITSCRVSRQQELQPCRSSARLLESVGRGGGPTARQNNPSVFCCGFRLF